jgi:hypothetical protein
VSATVCPCPSASYNLCAWFVYVEGSLLYVFGLSIRMASYCCSGGDMLDTRHSCGMVQNRVEPPEEPEQRPEAGAGPPSTPELAQQHSEGSGPGDPVTPSTPQTPNLNRPSHRLAVRPSGCY